MSNDLDELNLAIQNLDWSEPAEAECRFYYDAATKIGTQLNGVDCTDPWVSITREEYELMATTVASKFYLSKSGSVKPIPIAMGMRKLLEYNESGPYRTIKNCMIFADPAGADAYQRREFDYD